MESLEYVRGRCEDDIGSWKVKWRRERIPDCNDESWPLHEENTDRQNKCTCVFTLHILVFTPTYRITYSSYIKHLKNTHDVLVVLRKRVNIFNINVNQTAY